MKPKLYRLNHNWLGYKKGHVVEANEEGSIFDFDLSHRISFLNPAAIDLLIKSGALTEIKEPEEVKLPEKFTTTSSGFGFVAIPGEAPEFTLVKKINQIIAYLEAKENK